ncbi:hypothetical protein [Shewanella youngdeokensis]|uniref:HTH luxR-type domain-containing protein n=1 Tax=Shewanella youngdeokensis TaxID=2999068 RepID=A0ABZ0JWB6_9GAMM|nr:hypothetical protein RGE70_14290 [Shewanella sp. DAU334]
MKLIIDSGLVDLCEKFNADKCIAYFMLKSPVVDSKSTEHSMPIISSNFVCSHNSILQQSYSKYLREPAISKGQHLDEFSNFDLIITRKKAYASMSENVLSLEFRLFFLKKVSIKFIFFSTGVFNEDLLSKDELVKAKLLNFGLKLNREYKLIQNILLDSGVISRKVFHVINLIANGITREDAADKMNLSVSGVDYYIELAKQVLESKNMSEMVYSASQYGLINGEFILESNSAS